MVYTYEGYALGRVSLFPVIDGMYVVSDNLFSIVFFISDVFRSMAAEFIVLENRERSIIRGAFAHGPVILGEECKEGAEEFKETAYANSILIGMPLVQAFEDEKKAPPFGVFVHESARAFSQIGKHQITTPLWRWWIGNQDTSQIAAALPPCLTSYFDWCRNNPIQNEYPTDRLEAHAAKVREYFGEFEKGVGSSESITPNRNSRRRSLSATVAREAKPNPETSPVRQINKLCKILNLSETQVELIKPIIEAREKQVRDISRDKTLDREVRRMKIKDLVSESKARLQSFLTEAQKTILIEREHNHEANSDRLDDPRS